jgi:hypothetical protein
LLGGTAVPLAIGGLTWLISLYQGVKAGKAGKDSAWSKWTRNTGRNVGEVVWTFGPGVVGLVGGMSLIGHKVSPDLQMEAEKLISRNGDSLYTVYRYCF